MKKFIIAVIAFASVCVTSCKKETVNPEGKTLNNIYMKSGGGDKRPSGTYD